MALRRRSRWVSAYYSQGLLLLRPGSSTPGTLLHFQLLPSFVRGVSSTVIGQPEALSLVLPAFDGAQLSRDSPLLGRSAFLFNDADFARVSFCLATWLGPSLTSCRQAIPSLADFRFRSPLYGSGRLLVGRPLRAQRPSSVFFSTLFFSCLLRPSLFLGIFQVDLSPSKYPFPFPVNSRPDPVLLPPSAIL